MPLPIVLEADPGRPTYLRIAEAITAEIQASRLAPGARLPGTRALAEQLDVNRNTVVAAYDELVAQGWLEAVPRSGTRVAADLPRRGPPAPVDGDLAGEPGFSLPPSKVSEWRPTRVPGALMLSGGTPDLRLVPVAELARAYRRAVMRHGQELLDYGDPRGLPALREQLARLLASARGLAVGADDLLVTRGAQHALHLIAQTLVRPGDVVAVEALGYPPAWDALRLAGAELAPVPVDADGLDVDALDALCDERPVRAVYCTPHHQFPTMVPLSPARRLRLLELARRRRIAVIEDDYDHELHFDGHPRLPLARADHAGVVVYVGTLSKVLMPGIRLGFVAAPRRLLDELVGTRLAVDRQGDLAVEHAVAELLEEGQVARHVRRVRRAYVARREALAVALRRHLGGAVAFEEPHGGLAFWVRVDPEAVGDLEAWATRGRQAGVTFAPATPFAVEPPAPHALRLGFARLTPDEIDEAVRRMAATARVGTAGAR